MPRSTASSAEAVTTCYASLDAYSDPDLVRAAVRKAVDAGFSSVSHERDLPIVRAGREEAGPDVALMIDVNTAWTVNEARAMAGELREIGPKWLEEPVWPPENYDGLAASAPFPELPGGQGEQSSE